MDIEKQIESTRIESLQIESTQINKKKRLYISWILTTLQFIAMILQIIKYGTSGKAMVSGWSKTIQIIFCGFMNLYLKCSSYDFEYNNKYHVFVFFVQRTIIFGGEVIPKIQSVLSGGNIIWPKSNFVWDKNKTDIYLVDKDTKEVKLKKLEHFITKTGIGFYKSGLIKKGYEDINIKTIENFINLEKKDLLKMTGIKETSADKIIQSKNNALNNIHISTLASSTGYFPGVGERRMLVISEKIPNFLEMEYSELKNKIIEINGFSDSIANVVINGIEEFKKFISFFQKKYKILMKKVELKNTNGKLSNDIFIFTGFRDKNLEEKIKSLGGSITKNMNKKSNITYLVTKDINSNSIKLKKANEWNIKIINQKMLEQLIK